MRWIIFLLAAPAWADGCPEAPDISEEIAPLYDALKVAPNDMEARLVTNQMWTLWSRAPDEPSQSMLDEGMQARAGYDFVRALDRLDALVDYCPFYAEGYNQRAFVNFLREDYAAALPDLQRTIELNARHLGALSGLALTLIALGRDDEGQAVLRRAVTLNPFLVERGLLTDAPGKDL